MSEFFGYTNNSSASSGPKSVAELLQVMREVEEKLAPIRRKELLAAARISEMRCGQCGRKATVTKDAIVVCPHLMEEIRRRFPSNEVTQFDPVTSIAIEVFDDGPARF